ncbi:MAG: hypothetical protein K0S29_782 [Gammaproteobacteria bacterium]|jgi:hypothetical protein|nr:hypothetical protein [Gammaproteobacteria bacterium]
MFARFKLYSIGCISLFLTHAAYSITASTTRGLTFGMLAFDQGTSSGWVNVSSSGVVTSSSGLTVLSDTAQYAIVAITGTANTQANYSIASISTPMQIDTFSTSPDGQCNLDSSGNCTVNIGGKWTLSSSTPGDYSATLVMTINQL